MLTPHPATMTGRASDRSPLSFMGASPRWLWFSRFADAISLLTSTGGQNDHFVANRFQSRGAGHAEASLLSGMDRRPAADRNAPRLFAPVFSSCRGIPARRQRRALELYRPRRPPHAR